MSVNVQFLYSKKLQFERLKKTHLSSGIMASTVAGIAILWLSLGYLGQSQKLRDNLHYLPNDEGSFSHGYKQIVDTAEFRHLKLPPINAAARNSSVEFASMVVNRQGRLEDNIAGAGVKISENSPAENQYAYLHPTEDALDKSVDAFIAIKASAYLTHSNCRRFGISESKCAQFVSTLSLEGTSLGSTCASDQTAECNLMSKYRSIDGSCNNLENPRWGSALTAYNRLLFPHYSDGIQEPKSVRSRGIRLPSARVVTTTLSTSNDLSDVSKTLAVMQWTQFISHDISHTPVRNMMVSGKPIACCRSNGYSLPPREQHPDCAPISVPENDPVYSEHRIRCLDYVRSLPVLRPECNFGPAEQMNQVSHFLDGSTIYGSDQVKARLLRTFEGGKLRTQVKNNNEYLPGAEPDSILPCDNGECYDTGDNRANMEPHLAVMHTIWHREHNRLATELSKINPLWTDEILYQESRRLVIAEIQHITYNEWLPILIGKKYARAVGLMTSRVGHSHTYSPYDDPAISNEAATAALRFLNSLRQSQLSLLDDLRTINITIKLSDYFYKPKTIESNAIFDGLLRGLVRQNSQKMDLNIVSDMTHELYKTNGNLGLDVMSFDIQRGRDHGLPGYNSYRKYCGLPLAKTFEDFLDYIPSDTVKKLKSLYHAPEDVDLLIGGMAERPAEDGILGPTFRCIISEQFARTKRTDRFFYDSINQPHPFSPEQLDEIRNVTLARIFCDNGNNIKRMPKNVFIKSKLENEPRCEDFEKIPSIDLFAWAEKAKAYR